VDQPISRKPIQLEGILNHMCSLAPAVEQTLWLTTFQPSQQATSQQVSQRNSLIFPSSPRAVQGCKNASSAMTCRTPFNVVRLWYWLAVYTQYLRGCEGRLQTLECLWRRLRYHGRAERQGSLQLRLRADRSGWSLAMSEHLPTSVCGLSLS